MEVNLHIEGSGKRGLKRRASSSWGEGSGDSPSRKRLKDDMSAKRGHPTPVPVAQWISQDRRSLIDDMAQELECGCCAALVYNPVTIIHVNTLSAEGGPPVSSQFGRMLTGFAQLLRVMIKVWGGINHKSTIHRPKRFVHQNGGTSCPSCRGLSTSVIPSRILHSMVNVSTPRDSSKMRTLSERAQADEIYRPGSIAQSACPAPRPAINNLTDGHADSSAQGPLPGANFASQYGLCATLPSTASQGTPLVGSAYIMRSSVALRT